MAGDPVRRHVPLSARRRGITDPDELPLVEGVPQSLQASLWAWSKIQLQTARPGRMSGTVIEWSAPQLRTVERALDLPLSWGGQFPEIGAATSLQSKVHADEDRFLDLVDFLAAAANQVDRTLLETQLAEAGSVWTVAPPGSGLGLVERVDRTVRDLTETELLKPSQAARHLRAAWSYAYGRAPDPDEAYDQAIKAVEAVAGPVILPTDQQATLGKIYRALRDGRSHWHVAIEAVDGSDPVETIASMMETLWRGHTQRHGGGRSHPIALESATAAVTISSALVQLFNSGSVRRK